MEHISMSQCTSAVGYKWDAQRHEETVQAEVAPVARGSESEREEDEHSTDELAPGEALRQSKIQPSHQVSC